MNTQVPYYLSWFLDPYATANDVFSLSWENKKFYAFPSFNLIGTTFAKIRRDRLTGIMIILGARRKHALSTIYVDNIVFKDDKVILLPNKTLKHSKPTRPLQPLIYNAYKENIKLCLVNCLLSYLERRKLLVNDDVKEPVISYGKPHRPVSSDTLSKCINDELKLSGTDTNVFATHSCSLASVGKTKVNGMGINEIMKKECWKSESTFKKFYDKDIINDNNSNKLNFEEGVKI